MTPLLAIPIIICFLAALYVVPSWYTKKVASPDKIDVYACGEKGYPIKSNIRLRYIRFVSFFLLIELSPLLVGVYFILNIPWTSILPIYLAIIALAALMLTSR